jgi:hypothetical protein
VDDDRTGMHRPYIGAWLMSFTESTMNGTANLMERPLRGYLRNEPRTQGVGCVSSAS